MITAEQAAAAVESYRRLITAGWPKESAAVRAVMATAEPEPATPL